MALKTVSKFSRGSAAKPAESPAILPLENETKVSLPPEEQAPTGPQPEDKGREGVMATLKQEYLEGKPFDQIVAESGIPRATLYRWRKDQRWDEEKNRKLQLAQKLAESIAFYENPDNTETALAQANLNLLLRIQGMNLSKLIAKAAGNEAPDVTALAMSDALSKYSGMLEKLIKSDQSIKSGGVEKKEVRHIQAIDMDDAVNLALEMKRKGQSISVQEAMSLLTAQAASKAEKK